LNRLGGRSPAIASRTAAVLGDFFNKIGTKRTVWCRQSYVRFQPENGHQLVVVYEYTS